MGFYKKFPACTQLGIILTSLGLSIASCYTPRILEYPKMKDTYSKVISLQEKKLFEVHTRNGKVFFSNIFDGARLNNVSTINDTLIEVFIAPENLPINPSPWYAFKVWSEESTDIYIRFKYPEGFQHRYIPKLKAKSNNWATIDSTGIIDTTSTNYTVKLTIHPDTLNIAAQEVISSKKVIEWVLGLQNKYPDKIKIKNYASTPEKRDLNAINIFKGNLKNKPLIVLLTRQHPPEITGYYAFQSFVEHILNSNSDFLNYYSVLAFPNLNPDGVDMGHWRHNSNGIDLNRDWAQYNQKEVEETVKYIIKTSEQNHTQPILGLDFHSTTYDVFYTNKEPENVSLPDFLNYWFDNLENKIPGYQVNQKKAMSKTPVSKAWFLNYYNAVGITYEISDTTSIHQIQTFGKISSQLMEDYLLKRLN